MTTGRINQVTILNAAGEPRRHPARAGQSSSLKGGRGPRPAVPGAVLHRAHAAIRLPPLSFPRGRPPHRGRAPGRCHRVRSGPLRGRMPSAGPRPRRGGSLPGLASKCLGRVVPSGQPSTDSNRARRAGAGESSGASAGPAASGGPCIGGRPLPLPTPGDPEVDHGELAAGQWPRDQGTFGGVAGSGRALRCEAALFARL